MSIRWRLFGSYLLVVVLAAAILGYLAARATEQRYLTTLEAGLRAQALLISRLVEADLARGERSPGLTARVRALDKETGLRITLVEPDGRVLADSERDAATMANHRDRPEIRRALASGEGTEIRRSDTLHVNLLYLALRVTRDRAPVGAVRVALPLHQVSAAYAQIRRNLLLFGALAVALALLLSIRFSQRLTAAVADLSRAASRFSHGDLSARAHPRGHDELTLLGESFNDMAARVRTMVNELQEEKQKVETILTRLGEAVLVTDARGRLTLCNQAAERTFGTPCEQALGKGIVDITQSHALDTAFREAIATFGTVAAEVHVRFPRERFLEATVTAIAAHEVRGAVAVLHDVTALRRLEGVRREFVANASHELQTPVTAIKAMAETLLSGGQEDPGLREKFLPELTRQADRLGALVRDLLDLARIEGGSWAVHAAGAEVAEVVQDVVRGLAPQAAQREIALHSEVPAGLLVQAEWSALHRVLSNLLDNAIKYTEPGGSAGVTAARREDSVEIVVWDTGLGVPRAEQSRIFERFYRVDKARSRQLGGTGLGLSIVKHLVEGMGGRVSLESELGHGSTFAVVLPATAEAATAPAPPLPAAEAASPRPPDPSPGSLGSTPTAH